MKCKYCGLEHGKLCPSIKSIEYHANGKTKRVEFFSPADYNSNINPFLGKKRLNPLDDMGIC